LIYGKTDKSACYFTGDLTIALITISHKKYFET
jgi:hypothetical protein